MQCSKLKYFSVLFFLIVLNVTKTFAQSNNVIVSQDERFIELLNEKRKINSSIILNDKYKIQIFSGDNESSKKALASFKEENKKTDCTIVFNTPIYKVWIGSYSTRIDAEKKLKELRKKYPIAFLVKPNK